MCSPFVCLFVCVCVLVNDVIILQGRGSDAMCHVTSIELATTAVKTLSNLFEHCSVESSKVNLLSHS